jgi:hypothetical protein
MSRTLLGAAIAACAACAALDRSPTPVSTLGSPRIFPAQTLDGLVYARARWDERHDEAFGADLVRTADVLPLAVTIRLRGAGQDEARAWLDPERMAAELVLADGTTLPSLPARRVAERVSERTAERVERRALQTGLLSADRDAGWLYFDLTAKPGLELDGDEVEHELDGRTRRFAVDDSLLVFDVTFDDREETHCVGVGR